MLANRITKPCHNCRRRRLRCDRSWPTCHKCAASEQECLGYGKVFVWAPAIDFDGAPRPPHASGRRLSGQGQYQPRVLDSRALGAATNTHETESISAVWAQEALCGSHDRVVECQDQSIQQAGGPPTRPGDPCQVELENQQEQLLLPDAKRSHDVTSSGKIVSDDLINECSSRELVEPCQRLEGLGFLASGSLIDPLFQDLDRNSRYYLAHFADSLCKDLVARDTPYSNPFRELIPLTQKHPFLLQILIATSAIHWSNKFRPIGAIPPGLPDPSGYLAQLRSQHLSSRQALIDALTAKQKALGYLRDVLDALDPAGGEVILAAMHFLVKFDLIDLDRNNDKAWQVHMKGTSIILAYLVHDSISHGCSSRVLRDCVLADCFIYHILGSTLATGAIASRIARYAFELLPIIKRVEVNSYLSCPPELLQTILHASLLSYETPCTDGSHSASVADQALRLIDEALAFDISSWADRLRELPNVSDIDSRIHIASAHRSAVCLYILQALPVVRTVRPIDTMVLVGDIFGHLGQIDDRDPYFKATSWPLFIAGAETREADHRAWAMSRMFAIWEICPWGYIFKAIKMLRATWQIQDSGAGSGVSWLRDLKDMGFEYLIV
ncbi:hypothetical protein E4U57_003397 [Claviceps arundinis]|uniref:Zn(2)-C6 fungal-type domain-containing protein n=1 Tax=Claviceps arundinis TaxID=1623583 RepID=A0A9P7MZW3_9HYPO|nr:hypothetical protein E4U57_003397 [Claviceps arundinis]KAG5977653.1 hypothetical protein E4U56_007405 [Claviceps arundinis]